MVIDAFPSPSRAHLAGREVLAFAGCNYLGLAHHPRPRLAAAHAAEHLGLSIHASRATSGDSAELLALELDLRAHFRCEDVAVLPSGYLANLAAAQALRADHDLAILDEHAHPSLSDAFASAGLPSRTFPHAQAAAATALARAQPRTLVATDSVFGTRAVRAPIDALARGLPPTATLLLDDAHAFAATSPRGSFDHLDLPSLVVTGSLAKGLGCQGGFVAAGAAIIDRVRLSNAYVCSTPPSPSIVAAARAALAILRDEPDRFDRLSRHSAALAEALAPIATIPDPLPFAIINHPDAGDLHARLLDHAILIPLLTYPGSGNALRASVTSEHTPAEIDRLADTLRAML